MNLVLIRHCEIVEHSSYGKDSPLSLLGLEQAAQLAERLPVLDVAKIYSSPLLRAIETACYLSRALVLPVEIDNRLAEFGTGETWGEMNTRVLSFLSFVNRAGFGDRLEDVIAVTHGGPIQCVTALDGGKHPSSAPGCARGEMVIMMMPVWRNIE